MNHTPVMLDEIVALLAPQPGEVFVDGTLGLAGHAVVLAAALAPGGLLLGLDWDTAMLDVARERLAQVDGVTIATHHGDYRALPEALTAAATDVGRAPLADGILLDLGLNSAQIDDPTRGISFMAEGPLDMRMDRTSGEPASAWLNRAGEDEIEKVLRVYGDERWSRQIARVIVDRRKVNPLSTTADLVNLVEAAVPMAKRDRRLNPATRTFQAVRIWVNRELEDLESAIEGAAMALAPGGRLAVLAYHSGEDRAVKTVFRRLGQSGEFREVYRRPEVPTEAEIVRNPRSRSARLRALVRLAMPEPDAPLESERKLNLDQDLSL